MHPEFSKFSTHNGQSSDRKAHTVEKVQVYTFCDFASAVWNLTGQPLPAIHHRPQNLCTDEYDSMIAFLTGAFSKVSAHDAAETAAKRVAKEGDLQRVGFGYLSTFKDRTFENTGDGVKKYHKVENRRFATSTIGNGFRKLCFSRVSKTSRRVDLIIRCRFQNDKDILKVQSGYPELDEQRVAPWCVYSILDFKCLRIQLSAHIPQVAEYCSNILKISPGRRVVFCALTNFEEIIYVAAYLTLINGMEKTKIVQSAIVNNMGFKPRQASSPTTVNAWAADLAMFLSARPEHLGFNSTIVDAYGPRFAYSLGRGSYSAVIALKVNDSHTTIIDRMPVLKISRNLHALHNEYRILDDIRFRLHRAPDLLRRIPEIAADPVHNFLNHHSTVFEEVETVTPELIRNLWPLIRAIHEIGYVHRDIRLANIVQLKGEDLYGLIDFSSAHRPNGVPFTLPSCGAAVADHQYYSIVRMNKALTASGASGPLQHVPPAPVAGPAYNVPPGSLGTAATRVVYAYYANDPHSGHYACSCSDEVISLIHLVLHHHPGLSRFFREDPDVAYCPENGECARKTMEKVFEELDKLIQNPADKNQFTLNMNELSIGVLSGVRRQELLLTCLEIIEKTTTFGSASKKARK